MEPKSEGGAQLSAQARRLRTTTVPRARQSAEAMASGRRPPSSLGSKVILTWCQLWGSLLALRHRAHKRVKS